MKRLLALLLALVMLFSLAACGDSDSGKNTDKGYDEADERDEEENEDDDSDKDEESPEDTDADSDGNREEAPVEEESDPSDQLIEITITAAFFDGESEDSIRDGAAENGYAGCEINDDGSVTYMMTQAQYDTMRADYRTAVDEVIADLLEGENEVASFLEVNYNEDMTQFDIVVDPALYSMWDVLYAVTFCMTGSYYQMICGVDEAEIDVLVNYIDSETNEVLESTTYQEYIGDTADQAPEEEFVGIDTSAATPIELQQAVVIADTAEFFVDYSNITARVNPPQPGSWYSYYEADNDKVYVDICVSYKNLAANSQDADEVMTGTLIFGGKYQYSGFSIIEEDSRSDFTYSNITEIAPLSTEYLHYLFEVPAEIEASDGALTALLNIHGEEYSFVVRVGVEGEVATFNDAAAATQGGELSIGEYVSVAGKSEFAVEYATLTADVVPPLPGDWYSHYEAETGKVYLDLCVCYRSLAAQNVSADDIMTGTLVFGGMYQYSGFSIIEESSRSDFTYSNITDVAPLSTEYLHYLFELPAEAQNSEGSLEANLTINGKTFTVMVREGITGEVSALNPSSVLKSNGEIKLGDSVAIPNVCEFSVDYSNITADVVPPQPGDWYSHYEADAGNVYVDFCIAYKNWENIGIRADEVMDAELIYDGTYEYSGFSMIEEDSRGDFTYSNITDIAPLTTEYIHFLFEIPEDIQNDSGSLVVTFEIGGNTYTYTVR